MKRVILLALVGASLMGYSMYRRYTAAGRAVVEETQVAPRISVGANKASAQTNSQNTGVGTSRPSQFQFSSSPTPTQQQRVISAKQSLEQMTRVLSEFAKPNRRLADLVKLLKATNQDPVLSRSSNPYTGSMTVVRTNSPLPGTRYFHAQYLSGDDSPEFVQHMSFEYQPGASSFEQVKDAVKKTLGPGDHIRKNKKNFIQWERADGYVMWIKVMGPEDLEEHPFNAYTKADVGTIRVALEIDEEHDEH